MNDTLDISGLIHTDLVNNSISPMDYFKEHGEEVLKATDLSRICGTFSGQAKTAAIIGIILAVISIIYFGRRREQIALWLLKHDEQGLLLAIIDKLLLIGMAMCFAVIITRLFYAG